MPSKAKYVRKIVQSSSFADPVADLPVNCERLFVHSLRTNQYSLTPKQVCHGDQGGRRSYTVSEFLVGGQRILINLLCARRIARLHQNVCEVCCRIHRIPTVSGSDVHSTGICKSIARFFEFSEVGQGAAFKQPGSGYQQAGSLRLTFSCGIRGQIPLPLEL